MRLEGKVAVITGAGAGTGRIGALLVAREGAKVVVADIQRERAEAVAAEITAAGGTALAVQVDVTRETEVQAMIDAAVAHFGKLDILWNNAGISIPGNGSVPFEELSEEALRRVLDVNTLGVALGCKCAIPALRASGGGSIINTSSTAAYRATAPGWAIYCASKAGVHGLVRGLAGELGPDNIRINSVAPGYGGANWAMPQDAPVMHEEARLARMESFRDRLLPTALGWLPGLDEIAKAALFLASDEAAYITGIDIPVDGGWAADGVMKAATVAAAAR
jgi:NAD(P)-dependent dehydrogenase (short-subunit alcohol dehydrogenase family)